METEPAKGTVDSQPQWNDWQMKLRCKLLCHIVSLGFRLLVCCFSLLFAFSLLFFPLEEDLSTERSLNQV